MQVTGEGVIKYLLLALLKIISKVLFLLRVSYYVRTSLQDNEILLMISVLQV